MADDPKTVCQDAAERCYRACVEAIERGESAVTTQEGIEGLIHEAMFRARFCTCYYSAESTEGKS